MKVVVIGEILAEIMADDVGNGFREPQSLTGPFPSGAPAIFIDQVARLGQACGIISAVGDDDFGKINMERLAKDGVDTSAVRKDPDRPTGSAFVRYRSDGSRDFIFNITHSACGRIALTAEAERLLSEAGHLHVMGSSLSSDTLIDMNLRAAADVKARGGTVSFDPNVRKEMLERPGMHVAMLRILALTDLLLPSGEELTLLTKADEEADALAELFALGVRAVVHKMGAAGAKYHDPNAGIFVPGFDVSEIDPTGAGDCFGGAFTTFWLRGMAPGDALRRAAAAGALAVGKRGPMEGASTLEAIERFVANHEETV